MLRFQYYDELELLLVLMQIDDVINDRWILELMYVLIKY